MHNVNAELLRLKRELLLKFVLFLLTSIPQHNHVSFLKFCITFVYFVYMCEAAYGGGGDKPLCSRGDPRTNYSSQFSPFKMEALGSHLSLSSLVASTFTC